MKTLSETQIAASIQNLNGWSFANNALEKNFQFKDFKEALAFIVKLGSIAEEQNHHPELFNVYNKVELRLSTHDAGGVTEKDVDLAKAVDNLQ